MPAISFPPYAGTSRKLVLAIDVGTTFSGVSYAILDPGEVPTIQNVNRFPGQTVSDYKVPSVLSYYNKDGALQAAGAEAPDEFMLSNEEKEKLTLVEWFKLHLHSTAPADDQESGFKLKPLPDGKTVVDVFADFLRYLFVCAQKHIKESHPSGGSVWDSVQHNCDIILSHPNGWDGLQQAKLREAAVQAGLISDKEPKRIQFITEGEASINYCVSLGLAKRSLEGVTVVVIDAGGGTVDLGSYRFKEISPVVLEQTAPPACLLAGSAIIDMRFEEILRARLKAVKTITDANILKVLKYFASTVKTRFKDPKDRINLQIGTTNDNEKSIGLKNGMMPFSGNAVEKLFESTISAIVEAVKYQKEESSTKVSLVFLVGGFANSQWLYDQLKAKLDVLKIDLCRPDTHTNKAVAEGAVVHYLSHLVVARVARLTIGTVCGVDFDEANAEHVKRKDQAKHRPSGVLTVPGKFIPLVLRGTSLAEDDVVFRSMCRERKEANDEGNVEAPIMAYRGTKKDPGWVDEEPELFVPLCTISADTSAVEQMPREGNDGEYFVQPFDVVLACGKTEWNAYLRWKHEDTEKRGTAKIAYREDPSGQ